MSGKNPKIGTWTCERGGNADVFQTIKKGRHFYTHCECCGLNQGTGSRRQQQIFNEAQFIDKTAVVIPSGVSMSESAKVIEHEPAKPALEKITSDELADFDPKEIPADEPAQKPADKKPGGFARLLPGLALFAVAAGAGLWMN